MKTQVLIHQFDLQTHLFLNVLQDISEEESFPIVGQHLNSIRWVAGHVLNTRYNLIAILGGAAGDAHLNKLFGKGSTGKTEEGAPSLDEIKTRWKVASKLLIQQLQQVSEEKLMTAAPFALSIADKTVLGTAAFMAVHEGMHIGQLTVLRKIIGKSALSFARRAELDSHE